MSLRSAKGMALGAQRIFFFFAMLYALCSMRYALCSMRYALLFRNLETLYLELFTLQNPPKSPFTKGGLSVVFPHSQKGG